MNLAKQMEALMYNLPRKPSTLYENPITHTPSYHNAHFQAKQQLSINPHHLPTILFTPKTSFTPYNNFQNPLTQQS